MKIAVAIILTLVALGIVCCETPAEPPDNSNSNPAPSITQEESQRLEKAVIGMKESSAQLIDWAIILFGGTIGISILGKGAKIRDGNWGLCIVPPVWVFLYFSLLHGTQFKNKLTFQVNAGAYVFHKLNEELHLQQVFFHHSLVVLGALASLYLVLRLFMLEDVSKAGE